MYIYKIKDYFIYYIKMSDYLPKESPNSTLNLEILRTLWNNKIISKSLNVKNENEARNWFANHKDSHNKFEEWNKEFENKMKELQ